MRPFVVAASLVSASLAPMAASAAPSYCRQTKYLLAYENGVWSDATSAAIAKTRIATLATAALPSARRPLFRADLAFDHTPGKIAELYEGVRQSINSDYRRFWRILLGLSPMPAAFAETLARLGPTISSNIVRNADAATHVAKYKQGVLEGNLIVVLAHSQGNVFAAAEYGKLTADEKKSVGVVGVATPARSVPGGGAYTTSAKDRVIEQIAAIARFTGAPAPLPANATGATASTDPSGHSFVAAYLKASNSMRGRIVGQAIEPFSRLIANPNPAAQGAIVATLTWGAQPDVDLHAVEPGGDHVYYGDKRGASGTLDVDDTSGFGPEHYTVPCQTLQTGVYRIGVNYYRGSGAEVAHVAISAGQDSNQSFDVPLSVAVGGAGDASPIPAATVTVTGSAAAGYQFQIGGGSPRQQSVARSAAAESAAAASPQSILFRK